MPPKPPLTHFLCLPLVTLTSRPQLQTSLSRFAAEVSKPDANGEPQVPKRAIRPFGTLHFTIGVMSLQSPERIQKACEFLKSLDTWELLCSAASVASTKDASKPGSPALLPTNRSTSPSQPLASLFPNDLSLAPPRKAEPLIVALTNLSPMQSPASTSSLYASPNPLHPILSFAQRLHDSFLAAGFLLVSPNDRPLKLHVTLVNTIYTKKSTGGKNRWGKGSGKINARELIETWGETTWAEDVRVEKVAICEMGAKKVVDGEARLVDEVYTEVASVELP